MKELNVTTALEQDTRPIVAWNSPNVAPNVNIGDEKTFWVAVKLATQNDDNNSKVFVFDAQYLNKPVDLDDNGDSTIDDYLVDIDGEPMSAVGWFSTKAHADFDNYFEALQFRDGYTLLGWAEYQAPEFTGVSNK